MAERQEQAAAPDAVPTRIGQVVLLHHAGDREEARRRFLDLWTELGAHGPLLHRCTLAHYLADTHDDPTDELAWDLRALSAAEELLECGGPGGAHDPDVLAVRALYPSLQADLAADYLKLGRREAARTHLRRARAAARILGEGGWDAGVREEIARLARELGEPEYRAGQGGRAGGSGRERDRTRDDRDRTATGRDRDHRDGEPGTGPADGPGTGPRPPRPPRPRG